MIAPAIAKRRRAGIDASGPIPADTLFVPERLEDADAVLAMYHDQGLPVLKYASFGRGVNVTLGLPFVRTSVDHGTALDLAGTGTRRPRQPARGASSLPSSSHRPRKTVRPAFPARSAASSRGSSTRSIRAPGDCMVEIGPGRGRAHAPLLESVATLT